MKLFEKPISLFKTKLALPLFRLVYKLFSEKSFGRFSLIRSAYGILYSWLIPENVTDVLVEGMKIRLPGRDTPSRLATDLLILGAWERFETKLSEDSIHEGMLVVDIGANIG